jgi:hypothetical protein
MCTGHSLAVVSRVKRRKTLWLVSARLSYGPHCTYVYASTDIWQAHSHNLNPCPLQEKVQSTKTHMEKVKKFS